MLGITPAPRQGIDGYTMGGDIREHRFNPYKENGGTVAAIAGNMKAWLLLKENIRKICGPVNAVYR